MTLYFEAISSSMERNSGVSRRAWAITSAPLRANSATRALPIPLLVPVMKAVLPLSIIPFLKVGYPVVNLFSMMELTQLLLRYMMRRRHASIINLGSVLGLDMPVGSCAYGLSKAAVMAFTRTLAAECGHLRIRVNAVAPGLVDTEMADQMESKAEEAMIAQCAMKRRAKPEEIAKMVVFLASEESSFVNGQIIRIDGGKV